MYIGETVLARMNLLGFSTEMLAEKTMFDTELIDSIINNHMSLDDIDEFDLEVLSNALYCATNYFVDSVARSRDVVFCSMNRGDDTIKSNLAKAKIQSYMRDLTMLKDALC